MDEINWAFVDAMAINFALLSEILILAKWTVGYFWT